MLAFTPFVQVATYATRHFATFGLAPAAAPILLMLVTKPTKWLKHATSLPLRGVHPHGSRDLLVLDVGALAVGGIVAGVVGDLLIFIELILDGWCLQRKWFLNE